MASAISFVLAWPMELLDGPLDRIIYQDVNEAYSKIYDAYTQKTELKTLPFLTADFEENVRQSNEDFESSFYLSSPSNDWRVSMGEEGVYYAPETITFYKGGNEYELIKRNEEWQLTGKYIVYRD